jgi:hypothetical protein
MTRYLRRTALTLLILALGGELAPVRAGWLIISNNTPAVLIVQENRDDTGILRRPRIVRLLPGEVYREFHPGEGKTTLQVFDARKPQKPLHKSGVQWGAEEIALNLEAEGTSVKVVRAANDPKLPGITIPNGSLIVPVASTTPVSLKTPDGK